MTSAACVVKRHPCAACRAPASGNQMSFADLGLSDELLRAVEDSGYTEPTPVQRQAIPSVLMNKDLIAIAQTGTGKRSEEHTSELQSLMRISYAVFCLKKKTRKHTN